MTTTTEAITTEAIAKALQGLMAADLPRKTQGAAEYGATPTDAEIELARESHAAARQQAQACAEKAERLNTEIEAARKALQPRTDLAELLAGLTRLEIEARVRQTALPKDHAKNVSSVRAAIAEAEARRLESEALLPELERFAAEVGAEKRSADEAADRAGNALGQLLTRRAIFEQYVPNLARTLAAEAEIRAIADMYSIWPACRTAFSVDGTATSELDLQALQRHIEYLASGGAWPPKPAEPAPPTRASDLTVMVAASPTIVG